MIQLFNGMQSSLAGQPVPALVPDVVEAFGGDDRLDRAGLRLSRVLAPLEEIAPDLQIADQEIARLLALVDC
jgi:hypothetical protein